MRKQYLAYRRARGSVKNEAEEQFRVSSFKSVSLSPKNLVNCRSSLLWQRNNARTPWSGCPGVGRAGVLPLALPRIRSVALGQDDRLESVLTPDRPLFPCHLERTRPSAARKGRVERPCVLIGLPTLEGACTFGETQGASTAPLSMTFLKLVGKRAPAQESRASPAAASFHSRYQLAITVKVVATRSLLLRAKPMAIKTMHQMVNTSSAEARV